MPILPWQPRTGSTVLFCTESSSSTPSISPLSLALRSRSPSPLKLPPTPSPPSRRPPTLHPGHSENPDVVNRNHVSQEMPAQEPHLFHTTRAISSMEPMHRLPWVLELLEELSQFGAARNLNGRVTQRRALVGQGSYAKVYRGDFGMHTVCIKVLKEIHISSGQDVITKFCRRMLREVKVWAALRHPNIVAFHGWILEFSDEDYTTCAKLISAWCEGGTVLEYTGQAPNADRRRLEMDVSEGLTYLHSKDVIHGDIKPENIVVNAEGSAMLCDFGLSSVLDDLSTYAEGSSAVGTLRYTSPELLSCHVQDRDRRSDVWAFGCASGQVLYDKRPYATALNIFEVHRAVVNGEAPYEWDECDEFLANIERCLKQDPEERPTIEEVTQNFRNCIAVKFNSLTLRC
ncbi:kinase-like domain-containing protein [Cantharellus anzutake]|uniref:kinase-like domain-containing protein n=1 Tax=Cantharellus anzutake TaxID=1750568 RepID=UPI0019072148|nr:kinase-like domain-containing protein [Cantharellus anzutake]KAF8333055.1 kinase-like domain-containing protein [Cantharellus anzutake]